VAESSGFRRRGGHWPSVSVIIPTYNRADLLPAAVSSALMQEPMPLEVLVVDDGSTDATAEVCRRFPHPVRVIRQENAGAAAARNRGIAEAKGEIVAFLDSDDVWLPGKLAVQLEALAQVPDAGWCVSDCEIVDNAGSPIPGLRGFRDGFPVFRALGVDAATFFGRALVPFRFRINGAGHVGFYGDAFRLLFYGSFVFPSCALVRRDLCGRVGDFDTSFRCAEDNEWFHRIAAAAECVVVMTRLTRYRLGAGDALTSPSNTVQLIHEALESGRRAARLRRLDRPEREAFEWGQAELYRRLAYAHLTQLESDAARAAAREAMRHRAGRRWGAFGLYGASLLPRPALRGLGAVKRAVHG